MHCAWRASAPQLVPASIVVNLVVLTLLHRGVFMAKSRYSHPVNPWQTRLLSSAVISLAGIGALLTASTAVGCGAQSIVNEKYSDFAPAIAQLRQLAGQDRREIVRANMLLTESEAPRFWSLYDAYRAERQKLGDRRERLITDFLAQRDSMSEDQAAALAKEDFAIEKDKSVLKDKWYRKMTKELSERTVARFFHIDEKLDDLADVEIE